LRRQKSFSSVEPAQTADFLCRLIPGSRCADEPNYTKGFTALADF
jgi:hypothetical protein